MEETMKIGKTQLEKEHAAIFRDMKRRARELKKDPAAAKQFLIDAGISTPTGRLTKPYR